MFWYKSYFGLKTIVFNEMQRFIRLWTQIFLPPVITMNLYFIIFGAFIGARMPIIDGVSFMQFMAPGLVMMSIISSSFMNVVFSFYLFRFQKSIEEILVSPLPNFFILSGFCIGGMLRGLMVGLLILITAMFYTHIEIQHVFFTLLVAIMTSALFSLAGFINAVYAKSFDDISIVPTFVITPLTYLGGVFYSVKQLPPFWQSFAKLNPFLYIINVFRYGMLGSTDIEPTYAMTVIIVTTIILFAMSMYLLNKGTNIRS